jgi:hypothetical protein
MRAARQQQAPAPKGKGTQTTTGVGKAKFPNHFEHPQGANKGQHPHLLKAEHPFWYISTSTLAPKPFVCLAFTSLFNKNRIFVNYWGFFGNKG